jgi:hypothetical protein
LVAHIEEKCTLRLFKNMALKRISGPKKGNRRVEKTTKQGVLCSVLLTKYHSSDKIKTEMGEACSMYGGE